MVNKKTKKTTKKIDKKTAKKLATKKAPKKMKRVDEVEESIVLDPPAQEQADFVKTEIIIENGIVIVNPIYNPFDENNK